MGHLHKVRKNLQPEDKVTTEEIMESVEEDPSEDYLPSRKLKNREHIVKVTAVKFEDLKGISSSYQKGKFPHTSARGDGECVVLLNS